MAGEWLVGTIMLIIMMLTAGSANLPAPPMPAVSAITKVENIMLTDPANASNSGNNDPVSSATAHGAAGDGGLSAAAPAPSSPAVGLSPAVGPLPAGAPSTTDAPGTPIQPLFPEVEGDNLEGKRFRLPADFEGERNVVLIAFQRGQQAQVDTWVPLLRQLAAEQPDLRYYELPTIKEMGRVMRWVINSGMARGIEDPKARAVTITLYIDKGPFTQALGIRTEEAVSLAVVDRLGRVYWQTIGTYTPEKERALRGVLAER
jgi:hypothetical protein